MPEHFCATCSATFASENLLLDHLYKEHGFKLPVYTCVVCAAKFSSYSGLHWHASNFHKNKTPSPPSELTSEQQVSALAAVQAKIEQMRADLTYADNEYDNGMDAALETMQELISDTLELLPQPKMFACKAHDFSTNTTSQASKHLLVHHVEAKSELYQEFWSKETGYSKVSPPVPPKQMVGPLIGPSGHEDSKWTCKVCDMPFNLVVQAVTHVKKEHPELVDN